MTSLLSPCPLVLPSSTLLCTSSNVRKLQQKPLCTLKTLRNLACGAAVGEPPAADSTLLAVAQPQDLIVDSLKLKLLAALSGLNRGLAANEGDLKNVESAVKNLEVIGGAVDLSKDVDKLQGKWRLLYSSAFSSRTLGGSRPGPPLGRLIPITLGQVFQRIDVLSKDFDNVAELEFGTPWPLPQIEATATLAHKFELFGSSGIKITFEKTTVTPRGSFSQLPPLELPRLPDLLRPLAPPRSRSGEFIVTYLDSDTRITRGDRDELRVFFIA